MFKSQMKCQKILCFVALILAAIFFVYAIGFITSLYDLLYYTLDKDRGLDYTKVEGTQFFWELQTIVTTNRTTGETTRDVGFVDQLVIVAIVDILLAVVLFVTNTHKRRLYYVGNYVSTGLFAGYNVGVSIWMMIRVAYFENRFFTDINFEQLKAYCEEWNIAYNIDGPTTSFRLGYALGALLILVAIAAVLNLIWKIMLQKRENKLLNQSSVQEVAVNG